MPPSSNHNGRTRAARHRLTLAYSPVEWEEHIVKAAQAHGVSVTEFVRGSSLRAAKRALKGRP